VFRGRTARDVQQIRTAAAPVATATRLFSRTERLFLRFDVYGPAGTTPKVTMQLLNKLGVSMATLAAPTAVRGNTFEAEFSLGALPPGDYLIEIAAASGAAATRRLLAIRVTG